MLRTLEGHQSSAYQAQLRTYVLSLVSSAIKMNSTLVLRGHKGSLCPHYSPASASLWSFGQVYMVQLCPEWPAAKSHL